MNGLQANLVAQSLQVNSKVKPEGSVSWLVWGRLLELQELRDAQVKLAPMQAALLPSLLPETEKCVAELKAERTMLEKCHALEEQKFHLKQDELRLNLEAEIAKTVAKEQVLAAIAEQPSRFVSVESVKLEKAFNEEEEVLNPEAP